MSIVVRLRKSCRIQGRRRGFSLVEVVVAIALFGVTMAAFAGLSLAVARQSVSGWGSAQRTAALAARANDLAVVRFVDLNARAGCTTLASVPFARTECVTITDVTATRKRVRVTITPAKTVIHPAFVEFEVTRPPASNPFNTNL